jgi:hypothetical protein
MIIDGTSFKAHQALHLVWSGHEMPAIAGCEGAGHS